MHKEAGNELRYDLVEKLEDGYLRVLKSRNLVDLAECLAVSYKVHFFEYTIKNMNELIHRYVSNKQGIYAEVADDL